MMVIGVLDEKDPGTRTTVTLIGKGQARKGYMFIYQGPVPDCRECGLKNICFNLERGRRYRVVRGREKEHECGLFDDGVRVVEVERVPFLAGIPRHKTIEGSVITFNPQGCGRRGCENWSIAHPPGLDKNCRIKVLRIQGELECADGSRFKVALVDFAE